MISVAHDRASLLDAKQLEARADEAVANRRYLDGLRLYDRVIGLGAANASTWQKTGDALLAVNEFAQAIGAFQRAIALAPDRPEGHHNLARAKYTLGLVDEAMVHLRRTSELTHDLDPWMAMATTIPNAPSADHADVLQVRRKYASMLRARRDPPVLPARSPRATVGPIRVGYLSAHFTGRNYMKPVWALINHHDRARFQIHLLNDKQLTRDCDNSFEGYQANVSDQIHHVADLSDGELARLLQTLELDILVDLSAYSHVARIGLFAHRLPTITMGWFNMFGTSGFPAFDYIIGDDHVVMPEEETYYSERVVRLPLSYLTFEVGYDVPDVAPSPCTREGRFAFGSLISQYKITQPVLDAWAQILNRCPDATLVLANSTLKSPHNQEFVRQQFHQRGVDSNRLTILPPADHDTFLRYYDRIDLALDAFPYSGGTTTMEAIWQGVPVLTIEGDRWAARTSRTLLRECHLGEFVTSDPNTYVDQAVAWATSLERWPRLEALRNNMRAQLRSSSTCDGSRLATEMETIFRDALQAREKTSPGQV